MAAKVYDLTSGKIAVVTPYNDKVIAEAKRLMGQWKTAKIDGQVTNAWILEGEHKDAMQALVAKLFPPADQLVERTITWVAETSIGYSPTLDGYDLVGFRRDNSWIRRADADVPVKIIEVVTSDLETFGSRANPRLAGTLTLRVRCRAEAKAGGQGWTVEE